MEGDAARPVEPFRYDLDAISDPVIITDHDQPLVKQCPAVGIVATLCVEVGEGKF